MSAARLSRAYRAGRMSQRRLSAEVHAQNRARVATIVRQFVREVQPLFAHFPATDGPHRWSLEAARRRGVLQLLGPLITRTSQLLGQQLGEAVSSARQRAFLRAINATAVTLAHVGRPTKATPVAVAIQPQRVVVQGREVDVLDVADWLREQAAAPFVVNVGGRSIEIAEADSYFTRCPRDEHGWCQPGGVGAPTQPTFGTRDTIDSALSPGLRNAVHAAEDRVAPVLDKEIGIAFRPDGTTIGEGIGGRAGVRFTPEQLREFPDAVVVHNHPGGSTFSVTDVTNAAEHNVAEVRAVTPDGRLFVMRRPAAGWAKPKQIKTSFWITQARLLGAYDKAGVVVAKGQQQHNVWATLAGEFGMAYHHVSR